MAGAQDGQVKTMQNIARNSNEEIITDHLNIVKKIGMAESKQEANRDLWQSIRRH